MREVMGEAYGRVNLIGEHTDYNGGWVLPTSIPQKTTVRIKPRNDDRVVCTSGKLGTETASYTLGQEKQTRTWIDYIQGVTQILRKEGQPIRGFDIHVESGVPIGSGLSSSAALEISLLKGLREAFDLPLTDTEIAKIGQRTENEFVGARVGIMDQMACALAKAGEALFLDTQTLTFERVPLPLDKMDLIVINSGIQHSNAGGEYNERRSQCEEACHLLSVQQLRDLGVEDLPKLDKLPDVLKRRARHVVTENQRVHDAVKAIRAGDVKKLGKLFVESHASMKDDYQTSIPEIDMLVEIALQNPKVFGARLTGGGFGGSIVAITEPGSARAVAEEITRQYHDRTHHKAMILVP